MPQVPPAYLSIAEHFEHVCVKSFNGLVVAGENLLLNSAQVQRVRHLLIVLAVPLWHTKTAQLVLQIWFVNTKNTFITKYKYI